MENLKEDTFVPGQPAWRPWLTSRRVLIVLGVIALSIAAIIMLRSSRTLSSVEQDFNGVMMVKVPSGCFDMGNGDLGDEMPVTHICFNTDFWLDKTEVTNAQFTQFGGKAANPSHWTDANRPRESITWFEARDFCAVRGGRLPTEAEWEYAARGPDNLIYPWGNDFVADNVVYSENSNNQTAEVGSKPKGASWVGALDMSGNVWEWVSTLYKPYPYPLPGSNSELQQWINNTNTTNFRTMRGGSWTISDISYLRAAFRFWYSQNNTNLNLGFRCVVSDTP